MRKITIDDNNAGQRIDKFILKVLPGMSKSFSYKMFRKKNITLNGKKINGSELLQAGDGIKVFFSDETYDKFSLATVQETVTCHQVPLPEIIYEDEHLLVINKAVGVFSQPDQRGIGINQQIMAYYEKNGTVLSEGFKPGVANRLDRNTSGVILSAKDLPTIQRINGLIMDRQVDKRYRTIVSGRITEPRILEGYLIKNSNRNRVAINSDGDGDYIHTSIVPLQTGGNFTELEVTIKTGKPHQIRAHLSSIGHPIIGDGKYGHKHVNKALRRDYGLKHQLLHAWFYRFSGNDAFSQSYANGFTAPLPEQYKTIAEGILYD